MDQRFGERKENRNGRRSNEPIGLSTFSISISFSITKSLIQTQPKGVHNLHDNNDERHQHHSKCQGFGLKKI